MVGAAKIQLNGCKKIEESTIHLFILKTPSKTQIKKEKNTK